jgi:hypothetical protein
MLNQLSSQGKASESSHVYKSRVFEMAFHYYFQRKSYKTRIRWILRKGQTIQSTHIQVDGGHALTQFTTVSSGHVSP